jgi:NAD(P)-dependent dehydrogenase (short-subunit alcohol dehydrogenase family)
LKYAAIGMHVIIVDINQEALDTAVKSIKGVTGVGEVWGLKVDVSKIDEVVAMREKVFEEFGEVCPLFLRIRKELIEGACTHGQRWYWQDHPGHVDYNPPCRITE